MNTVSNDLVLSNGAVSRSILRAGGPVLQDECNQYISSNGKPQIGGVVVTGPGNIPCKHIIHTVGAKYNKSAVMTSVKVGSYMCVDKLGEFLSADVRGNGNEVFEDM